MYDIVEADKLKELEAEGKRDEADGYISIVKGVLKRGKAYSMFNGSQREAAKFFGIGLGTIQRYLDVTHGVGHPEIRDKINALEEPSLRKMLAVVKPKKKEEAIEAEIIKTVEDNWKEEVMKAILEFTSEEELNTWGLKRFGSQQTEELVSDGAGNMVTKDELIAIQEKELEMWAEKYPVVMDTKFSDFNDKIVNGADIRATKKDLERAVKKAGDGTKLAAALGVHKNTTSGWKTSKATISKKASKLILDYLGKEQ